MLTKISLQLCDFNKIKYLLYSPIIYDWVIKCVWVVQRDTMSSLGKEYAMRCEEEGFGGIYAKNHQKTPSKEDDNGEEDFSANAKAPSGSGTCACF